MLPTTRDQVLELEQQETTTTTTTIAKSHPRGHLRRLSTTAYARKILTIAIDHHDDSRSLHCFSSRGLAFSTTLPSLDTTVASAYRSPVAVTDELFSHTNRVAI